MRWLAGLLFGPLFAWLWGGKGGSIVPWKF